MLCKGFCGRLFLVLLISCCATSVLAQFTETDSANSTGFTPNTVNDLLLNSYPIYAVPASPGGQEGTGTNWSLLTDGSFGTVGAIAPNYVVIGNNSTLVYQFNTPFGATISNIDTYSGWQDGGRIGQNYTVLYQTVNQPNVWIPLNTVSYQPGGNSTQVDLAGSLTGVAALQFSFPGQQNGYVGYREITVTGTAGAAPTPSAGVGVFSSVNLGGGDLDSSVGLNANKTYINAVNVRGSALNINGVDFLGSGGGNPSGGNWSTTNYANQFTNAATNVAGGFGTLLSDFNYGDGANPQTLTLSNLTVGQTYVLTFYNMAWETGNRRQVFTTTGGASTTFNQDLGAGNDGNLLRYTFVATGGSETVNISPLDGGSFHLYGFSTEQVFNNPWTGATNQSWNDANWTVTTPNYQGANAFFTAQNAPTTVTLDMDTTVGHVQFDGTNPWTVSGASTLTLQTDPGGVSVLAALAGTHNIATPVNLQNNVIKFGAGTLVLSNAVTSNGNAITISAGTLQFGDGVTNTVSTPFDGNITNNASLVFNHPNDQSYPGVISGSGGVKKTGAGTLSLTSVNTYTGPTTMNAGTLNFANGSLGFGNLTFTGGVLQYGTGNSLGISIGNIKNSTSPAVIDTNSNTGAARPIDSSNTAGLTKTGAGTLFVTGANHYQGATTVSGGTLAIAGATTAFGILNSSFETFDPLANGSWGYTPTGATWNFSGPPKGVAAGISGKNNIWVSAAAAIDGSYAGYIQDNNSISQSINVAATGLYNLSFIAANRPGYSADDVAVQVDGVTVGWWPASTFNTGGVFNSYSLDFLATAGAHTLSFQGTQVGGDSATAIDNIVSAGYAAGSLPAGTAVNLSVSGAALDVGGGNQTIGSLAGVAGTSVLNDGGLTTGGNSSNTTFAGVISGLGSVTKTGAGTFTLTSANTFSGATVVNAGTLALSGTASLASTAITVSSGAVLDVRALSSAFSVNSGNTLTIGRTTAPANDFLGSLTVGGGTVNIGGTNTVATASFANNLNLSGGEIVFDLSHNAGSGNDTVKVVGNLDLLSPTTIMVNKLAPTLGNGNYLLFTYGGLTGSPAAELSLSDNALSNRQTASFITIGNSVYLQVNGNAQTLVWAGAAGSQWNNNTANKPWTNLQSQADFFAAGDSVTFDDTNSNTSVIVGETVAPSAITVAGSQDYTFSGPGSIGGDALTTLTMNGTGKLTIATSGNSYGDTVINGGTVQIGSGGTAGSLGTGAVVNNSVLLFNRSGSIGVANVISGSGSLVQVGGGTVMLNGANTYTGPTTLAAGMVNLGSVEIPGTSGPLGQSAANNPGSIVLDGGYLQYSAANQNDYSGRFSVAANQRYNVDTNGQNVTWATALTSAGGSLIKTGSGTLTLTGSNTYTGGSTVNAGTLSFVNGALPGNITFTGNAALQWAAGNTQDISAQIQPIGSGITATLDTLANNVTLASALSGAGGIAKIGSGTLFLASTNNAYAGGTTLAAGTVSVFSLANLGSGPITFNGGVLQITGTGLANFDAANFNNASFNGGFDIPTGNTFTVNQNLSGTGSVNKSGGGTLVLNGENGFSGGSTINAGVVVFNSLNATGGAPGQIMVNSGAAAAAGYPIDQSFVGRVATSSSGAIALGASSANDLDFSTFASASLGAAGSQTYSGVLTPNASVTTGFYRLGGGGGTLTFLPAITDGVLVNSLTIVGPGTVVLPTANSYTGATTISGGRALLADQAGIPDNTALALTGGTLDLGGFNKSFTQTSNFAAGGTVINSGAATATITLTAIGSDMTIASLLKDGASPVAISVTSLGGSDGRSFDFTNPKNSFSGGLTVDNASARIVGTDVASGFGTGTVTINNGGFVMLWTNTGAYAGSTETIRNNFVLNTIGGSQVASQPPGQKAAIFADGAGGGSPNTILTGTITLASDGGVGGYPTNGLTIQGKITGPGALYKDILGGLSGGNVVTLTNSNNDYQGGTVINNGTLAINSDGALGLATGGVNFAGNSTLQAAANNIVLNANRPVTVNATMATVDTQGFAMTIAGPIDGAGGLTKAGSGLLTLSNTNNSYGGITILAGGTTNVASIADYGLPSSLGNRGGDTGGEDMGLLFRGGTLQYTGSTPQSTNRQIRVSTVGGGAIDASGSNPNATLSFTADSSVNFWENGGARTLTLTGSNSGLNLFAMTIPLANGPQSVLKSGPGRWVLSGVNTYNGSTTINGGVLALGNAAALAGGGPVTFSGGALQYTASNTQDYSNKIVNSSGPIAIDTNGQTVTFGYSLTNSNSGGLTKAGAGTLIVANNNAYSGPTVVQGGTLKLQGQLAGSVTIGTFTSDATSGIDSANTYTHALAFAYQGITPISINGVTFDNANNTGGAGSLGTGWTIDVAGNIAGGNFPAGFQPAADQATNSLLNQFYYPGGNPPPVTLTLSGLVPGQSYDARLYYRRFGAVDNRTADFTFSNGVTTRNAVVNADVDANGHYIDYQYTAGQDGTATISEVNDLTMQAGGSWHWYGFSNQLISSAANTTMNNLLPTTTALSIAAGATLDLNGASQQVGSLADVTPGSGGKITNSSVPAVLTVSPTGSTTFSGTIEGGNGLGAIGLVVNGPGTLVLSGSNTFTGGTSVYSGTLELDSSHALLDGSSLTVDAGNAFNFNSSAAAAPATGAVSAVPEPGTLALLAVGALLAGFATWRRRRN